MNYLERLIRRATLQAGPGRGEPLYDPFEHEAEWELDAHKPPEPTPISIPAPQQIQAASPTAPIAAPLPGFPPQMPQAQERRAEFAAPPSHDILPSTTMPRRDMEQLGPLGIAASPNLASPAPSPEDVSESLAQADRFMRSLNLPMPNWLPEAGQEAHPAPPLQPPPRPADPPPRAEAKPGKPPPSLWPASPPLPTPPPTPQAAPQETANRPTGEDGQTRTAGTRLAAAAPQIVVVEAETRDAPPRIGTGAPYFGLGQL